MRWRKCGRRGRYLRRSTSGHARGPVRQRKCACVCMCGCVCECSSPTARLRMLASLKTTSAARQPPRNWSAHRFQEIAVSCTIELAARAKSDGISSFTLRAFTQQRPFTSPNRVELHQQNITPGSFELPINIQGIAVPCNAERTSSAQGEEKASPLVNPRNRVHPRCPSHRTSSSSRP